MILDGQNEIFRGLKTLMVKLDEVVGRQERELSMLTMISQAQPQSPPAATDQRQVIAISVTKYYLNGVNARRARLVPGWMTVFGQVYHLGM